MPLAEHLSELRRRIVVSILAVAIALIPGWMYYDGFLSFLLQPLEDAVANANQKLIISINGVVDPFTLKLQIVTVAAVLLASPVWLFQLWRFITPGLHRNEKLWAFVFILTASPLALGGAAMAYWTLPMSLKLLIGFTPTDVSNIIPVDTYFGFVFRMMAVFAVGFLMPFFVVLLNLADVLRARTIRTWWRGGIMTVLVFAAVATPTGDPLTMSLVAAPILVLVVLAWAIAAINDWRRRKSGKLLDELPDDVASSID